MNKKKIKLVWIGSGFVSQVAHLSNFYSLPNVEIVAIAELRKDIAMKSCQRFNIKKYYSDYKEMLKKEKYDGVVLIVRRYQTAPIAYYILNSKKHLFTEKPMAPTYDQAKLLVDTAKKNKCMYSTGLMRRHDDGIKYALNLIKNLNRTNKFGKFINYRYSCIAGGDYCNIEGFFPSKKKISTKRDWPTNPQWLEKKYEKEYEKFLNYFIHNFNLLRYLFGEVENVKNISIGKDFGSLNLNHKNYNGTFDYTYLNNNDWIEKIEIYYEKYNVLIDIPPAFLKNITCKIEIKDHSNGKIIKPVIPYSWSFKNQAESFVNSLRNKKLKNEFSGSDSLLDIKLIDNIWKKKIYQLD
ncbi:Gfo/Idh/MocA family oxidoreductase [Candidatus Pelagibacter sp.]|nr:Gfo/Idh/MocA family oxidoreductase [Candidatus Pelagibacter sp.]